MKVKMIIKGKVHDVGYRLFLLEEADYLFIPKFDARNVKIDGKEALIVLVEGDEKQLRDFIEYVKTNKPEKAVVEEIRVEEYEGRVRDIEKFRASLNTAQLSKIVQVGLSMLEKQDLMLKRQDSMIEKQDETIKEIRNVKETIKVESEKTRDELGGKVDLLRSDLKEYLELNLKEIHSKISEIEKALKRAGIM
ncbi:acylphosphatase [Archaeoglobus veneficus]|uniref:acylphosphatase n=1 Tax=Archaeoglobus veneficus (strain DSM 11195 / SNP6) TaxID=693661 RepID=F2KQ01_ARCVS|nr:acylphosphatase [Archaeoglobus veneficus]AEA46508.1 acylphosphatase [Archaeoglobus veneficus SNP6]